MSDVPQVSAIPVLGLPEIVVDDDLGALIVGRCEATGIELLDGDLVWWLRRLFRRLRVLSG